MLIITIHVDAPSGQAIGIKEDFATYCEKFGDVRFVDVKEELPEQMKISSQYPSDWRQNWHETKED